MAQTIRACIDRFPPGADAGSPDSGRAADAARRHGDLRELALACDRSWQPGQELRIRFLDGPPALHRNIEAIAREWLHHAYLSFDFGPHDHSEIRVTLQGIGHWSFIGTDALQIPQHEPTMNFEGWNVATPVSEMRPYVLHEFGHALGCIHEHQSPAAEIPWDREAVYSYYAGLPNFWDLATVDHNLFETYSRDHTNFTEHDPSSIMQYPVPKGHTMGDFEIGWNRELSEMDRRFIAEIYPRPD